jgi:hypothetical protein
MTQDDTDTDRDEHATTTPDAAHPGEATSPPSNPETDEQAVDAGKDRLDQAGR